MARIARARGLWFALLVSLAPSPVQASDDDTERAEIAFRDGNRAFAIGDYQAAFAAYRAAWSLKQTFDIACNLGRTEVELSLSRDAAEHLDFCLRTFSVSSRGEVRDANKRFRELFARVRRDVAALTVEVRPAGAEITVDGASYGIAPLGHDIFLDPGMHRVRVRQSGYEEEERIVDAQAAGSISVTFSLLAVRAVSVAPVTSAAAGTGVGGTPAPSANRSLEPRTIVVMAGAGLALVALGIGVGFTLDAGSAREDASKLGRSIHQSPAGGCGDPTLPYCQELQQLVDRQERSRDAADIALGTGAVLAAATLGAWLVIPDRAKPGTSAQFRAAPWVSLSSSGMTVSGNY
jgi:hypothetical protein